MSFNGHFEKYQKTLKLVLLAHFTQNENESQENEGKIRIFLGQLKKKPDGLSPNCEDLTGS